MHYNGKGQYFAILAFLSEIVGPFSYINWILAKAKLMAHGGHIVTYSQSQNYWVKRCKMPYV